MWQTYGIFMSDMSYGIFFIMSIHSLISLLWQYTVLIQQRVDNYVNTIMLDIKNCIPLRHAFKWQCTLQNRQYYTHGFSYSFHKYPYAYCITTFFYQALCWYLVPRLVHWQYSSVDNNNSVDNRTHEASACKYRQVYTIEYKTRHGENTYNMCIHPSFWRCKNIENDIWHNIVHESDTCTIGLTLHLQIQNIYTLYYYMSTINLSSIFRYDLNFIISSSDSMIMILLYIQYIMPFNIRTSDSLIFYHIDILKSVYLKRIILNKTHITSINAWQWYSDIWYKKSYNVTIYLNTSFNVTIILNHSKLYFNRYQHLMKCVFIYPYLCIQCCLTHLNI